VPNIIGASNTERNVSANKVGVRFSACRDIACGEELVTSYSDFERPHLERQSILKQLFGIDCSCEVSSMRHEELKVSDKRRVDHEKLEATMIKLLFSQPQSAYEAFERGHFEDGVCQRPPRNWRAGHRTLL